MILLPALGADPQAVAFAEDLKAYFKDSDVQVLDNVLLSHLIADALRRERPDVLLLYAEIDGNEKGLALLRSIRRDFPVVRVVLVGPDEVLAAEALRLGVFDIVPAAGSLNVKELERLLRSPGGIDDVLRLLRPLPQEGRVKRPAFSGSWEQPADTRDVPVFAFFTPRPGSGCTTVVANVAAVVSRRLAGAFLGRAGIFHPNSDRMDRPAGLVEPGVLVLGLSGDGHLPLIACAPDAFSGGLAFNSAGVAILQEPTLEQFNSLRDGFQVILADLSGNSGGAVVDDIISEAARIIFVVTQDPLTIRLAAGRLKDFPKSRVSLVVNRHHPNVIRLSSFWPEEIFAGVDCLCTIPDDPHVFYSAQLQGQLAADSKPEYFTRLANFLLKHVTYRNFRFYRIFK